MEIEKDVWVGLQLNDKKHRVTKATQSAVFFHSKGHSLISAIFIYVITINANTTLRSAELNSDIFEVDLDHSLHGDP